MIDTRFSKNKSWNQGDMVKVGFLTLKVTGIRQEKDYLPDIYELSSLDGLKQYEFIPHHGLNRIY
jgi:hypothetical protein